MYHALNVSEAISSRLSWYPIFIFVYVLKIKILHCKTRLSYLVEMIPFLVFQCFSSPYEASDDFAGLVFSCGSSPMQLARLWRSSAVTQRRAFQLNPASVCAHKDTRHVREEVILKVCPALATPVDCHADCVGI